MTVFLSVSPFNVDPATARSERGKKTQRQSFFILPRIQSFGSASRVMKSRQLVNAKAAHRTVDISAVARKVKLNKSRHAGEA
jgi:hypothetical protein